MKCATHRQHMGRTIEMRPRFESRPYRQSASRRQHIYGPLHDQDGVPVVWPTWLKLWVSVFGIAAVCLTVVGG